MRLMRFWESKVILDFWVGHYLKKGIELQYAVRIKGKEVINDNCFRVIQTTKTKDNVLLDLNTKEARELRDFLNKFLEDKKW